MIKNGVLIGIGLSCGGLTLGFALIGNLSAALGSVLVGAGWMLLTAKTKWDIHFFGLGAVSIGGVYALWAGSPFELILAVIICAIFAWEWQRYTSYLQRAAADDEIGPLAWRQFQNLLFFSLGAYLLSLAAVQLRLHISFLQAIGLVLTGMIGILLLSRQLQKYSR